MIILGTNSIKDTGFDVANSARFGVNTYMHKAFSSDNEKDTWTFSLWVKRGNSGSTQRMMTHNGATSGKFFYLRWESNEQLHFHIGMSDGNYAAFDTTQVFRDHSAWYHIVCAVDTTQGTEANRVKIYVNGSQLTAFGTANYPAQNTTASIGRTDTPMVVGALYGSGYGITSGSPQEYYDGYLAEVCFIDDAQLAADSFGEFDSDSGIWKPINVSGLTFGTDGFYLDFEDSGNLGNDANGGTDLTEVNLAATDQSTDTCTNNFSTYNPLQVQVGTANEPVFRDGNLTIHGSSTGSIHFHAPSTIGVTQGKWYAEFKGGSASNENGMVGVTYDPGEDARNDDYPGQQSHSYGYYVNGNKYTGDSASSYGDAWTTDIIGVALDLDNHKLYFSKNGVFQNSGDPTSGSTGTGSAFSLTTGQTYFFSTGDGNATYINPFEANFGSPPFAISSGNTDGDGYGNFEYAVPSGYFSLCTKNLAEYG
jgi:hypothetical protein